MNELHAFSQHGRKGIAYDWQSLCDTETLESLQELEREVERELGLATSFSE